MTDDEKEVLTKHEYYFDAPSGFHIRHLVLNSIPFVILLRFGVAHSNVKCIISHGSLINDFFFRFFYNKSHSGVINDDFILAVQSDIKKKFLKDMNNGLDFVSKIIEVI